MGRYSKTAAAKTKFGFLEYVLTIAFFNTLNYPIISMKYQNNSCGQAHNLDQRFGQQPVFIYTGINP
jgi:hypothetical protein